MRGGQSFVGEERTRDEETGRVTARRITSGGMDVPTWGVEGFGVSSYPASHIDRTDTGLSSVRRMGQQGPRGNGGGGNGPSQGQPQVQGRALAPTGNAPGGKREN